MVNVTDSIITGTALLGFVLFVVVHAALFRIIPAGSHIRWMLKLLLIIPGAYLILASIFAMSAPWVTLTQVEFIAIIASTILLFVLEAVVYIMTIYSFAEASITLRLLAEIAAGGGGGVSKKQILKKYNVERIVLLRMVRLTGSGEIKKSGQRYIRTGRISAFTVRHVVNSIFFRLFPKLPLQF